MIVLPFSIDLSPWRLVPKASAWRAAATYWAGFNDSPPPSSPLQPFVKIIAYVCVYYLYYQLGLQEFTDVKTYVRISLLSKFFHCYVYLS